MTLTFGWNLFKHGTTGGLHHVAMNLMFNTSGING